MSKKKTKQEIIERVKKFVPSHKDQLNLIATLLGTSGHLCSFIFDHYQEDLVHFPEEIHYSMLLTANNISAFMGDGRPVMGPDLGELEADTKKKLYALIKTLYNHYKEEIDG